MTTTAIGLFDWFSEAQRLIHTLVAQGIRRDDITIIANREETSVSDVLVVTMWRRFTCITKSADEPQNFDACCNAMIV